MANTGQGRNLSGSGTINIPATIETDSGSSYFGSQASASGQFIFPQEGNGGNPVINVSGSLQSVGFPEYGLIYEYIITITIPSVTYTVEIFSSSSTATFSYSIPTVYGIIYDESEVPGHIGQLSVNFSESVNVGQNWSISIEAGSESGSQSGTLMSADLDIEFKNGYYGVLLAGCQGQVLDGSHGFTPASSSVSITHSIFGAPMGSPGLGYIAGAPHGPMGGQAGQTCQIDTTNGISVTSTINSEGFAYGAYGGAQFTQQFKTNFNVTGQIYELDLPYPAPVSVMPTMHDFSTSTVTNADALLSGPSLSGTPAFPWQASAFTCGFSSNGLDNLGAISLPTAGTNYLTGFSLSATTPSLLAAGEQLGVEVAMEMPITPYNALTVAIESEVTVDTLTSATNWAPSPATGYPNTTAPRSGVLQFDTSHDSSGNPVTQAWVRADYSGAPINVTGYRFLRFDVQSVNNSETAFTVQITEGIIVPGGTPDKIWNCKTGAAGAFQTITIDLCAPNSGGPINNEGPGDSAVQQDTQLLGEHFFNEWGVGEIKTFRLNFPGSPTDKYQIQNFELFYNETPKWSLLAEVAPVEDGNYSTVPTPPGDNYYYRVGTVDVDGRRGLEIAGSLYNPGDTPEYTDYLLSDAATAINKQIGYSASAITSTVWNYSPAANNLGGNGGILGGQAWIENPTASATIQGQIRAVTLYCPPQCGDVFGVGGSSGDVPIHALLRLRGNFTGLTLDIYGQPKPGESVTVSQTGSLRGGATSDYEARFVTGAVYPVELLAATVAQGGAGVSVYPEDRLIRRVCPRGNPPRLALAYDLSLQWKHARLTVDKTTGVLWFGSSPNGNPYSWTDYATSISSQAARMRWEDHGAETIGILYPSAPNLLWTQTPDEGGTFGSAITISSTLGASGAFDYEETSDFLRWFYWQEGSEAPYAIYMCVLDAQNNVVVPRSATTLTTTDQYRIVARELFPTGGGRAIGLMYSQGGALYFASARDGCNFGSPIQITTSAAASGFCDFDLASDLNLWFYWLQGSEAPYTVYSATYDQYLNQTSGASATSVTNSDLAAISVKEWYPTGGGRSIGIVYSVGGSVTFLTSRNGIAFS
jgi:hypothetical protein